MQAIKEKITDLKEIRKAKHEAKEEEKAEREIAKARMEVAREVRMAREAEAAMDFHVQKAAEKAAEHEKKFPQAPHEHDAFAAAGDGLGLGHDTRVAGARAATAGGYSSAAAPPAADLYAGGAVPDSGHDKAGAAAFTDAPSSPFEANASAAPPSQNNFL